MLERHTRSWLEAHAAGKPLARASIEAAMLSHELRKAHRLDLGALLALHLYRAAWDHRSPRPMPFAPQRLTDAALRLFVSTATELLDQVERLLEDPKTLAHAVMDVGYVFTYPAVCGRLVETFSLLALTEPSSALGGRATVAVATLAANHPGTARPPSDQFAAAILPTTAVLARTDVKAARAFVRKVSQWLLAPTNSPLGRLWTRSCWPRSPEPVTMSARSRSSWVRESRTTQADETWAQRAPGLASCGQQCPSAYWTSRCVALR